MNILEVTGSFTCCNPEGDHNAKCFILLYIGVLFRIQSSIVLAKCYIPIES